MTHTEKEPRKPAAFVAVGRRERLGRLGVKQAHALVRDPVRLHQREHALLVALCTRSPWRACGCGGGGCDGQRSGERGGRCGREMRERDGCVGPRECAHVLL